MQQSCNISCFVHIHADQVKYEKYVQQQINDLFLVLIAFFASLILAYGFLELGSLCTGICRITAHSCKDTKKATPLDFSRGMSWQVYLNQGRTNYVLNTVYFIHSGEILNQAHRLCLY